MSNDYWRLVSDLIPASYSKQAEEASRTREKEIQVLLRHKKIPEEGWDDELIEVFLRRLSLMDSNNFDKSIAMGERESRFASEIVKRRHFGMGHGIGRSGDLTEPQPKAAGSSLMYKLTNFLVKDLLRIMGVTSPVECMVVPLATSMSLGLCFQTLRALRPSAKYIIWSRIDQKACFKSMISTGFVPIVINTILVGEQLITNLEDLEDKLKCNSADEILCVMSTTSCFAPRACDKIENIAQLCKFYAVPHIINNAYGLQSKYIMSRIQKAGNAGRVDVFVQSTDKNLMVPVGGAIIASFDAGFLKKISQMYPGRASGSPITDVFITLLSLGRSGYLKLVEDRDLAFKYLLGTLKELGQNIGEKVLSSPENPISISITLTQINKQDLTRIGSMLFTRFVTGTRVVTQCDLKVIHGHTFNGWGSHTNKYMYPYLTCAASIGITDYDIKEFVKKIDKIYSKADTPR